MESKAFELIAQLKEELANMAINIEGGYTSPLELMSAVKGIEELAKNFNTAELKQLAYREALLYKEGRVIGGFKIVATEKPDYSYVYPASMADMLAETERAEKEYKKFAQALSKMGHGEASITLPTGELVKVQSATCKWTQIVTCTAQKINA